MPELGAKGGPQDQPMAIRISRCEWRGMRSPRGEYGAIVEACMHGQYHESY